MDPTSRQVRTIPRVESHLEKLASGNEDNGFRKIALGINMIGDQLPPLRALVVLNWLNRGGIELMLLRAVPHLAERNIQLDLCCLGGAGDLDRSFSDLGCKIYKFARRMQWARGRNEVASCLEQTHYDVVHSQFGFTSGGIVAASADREIPCLVSIHNTQGPGHSLGDKPIVGSLRSAWLQWHKHRVIKHAVMIVGHSHTNLDAYQHDWQRYPNRFYVLHNGVEISPPALNAREAQARLGLDPHLKHVLNVGTMKLQKNHDGLLQIFAFMCQRRKDLHLSLVGDGPLRPSIETQIRSLGIADRVTVHGRQADVSTFYAAADLFLFPSHFEGFGNVLVEAQAARLPIVATDIPPIREAVCSSQHDFLFPIPNYDLASDLACQQLDACEKATARVDSSQDYVRTHFSIEHFSENLSMLYRRVLARLSVTHPKELNSA